MPHIGQVPDSSAQPEAPAATILLVEDEPVTQDEYGRAADAAGVPSP